jgi:hypothetical protein
VSEPAVQWGQLLRYLNQNGYSLENDGGDVIVSNNAGKVHRIGHIFCNHRTTHISPGHLSALKRKFGITRKDILGLQ